VPALLAAVESWPTLKLRGRPTFLARTRPSIREAVLPANGDTFIVKRGLPAGNGRRPPWCSRRFVSWLLVFDARVTRARVYGTRTHAQTCCKYELAESTCPLTSAEKVIARVCCTAREHSATSVSLGHRGVRGLRSWSARRLERPDTGPPPVCICRCDQRASHRESRFAVCHGFDRTDSRYCKSSRVGEAGTEGPSGACA
jgi:hypothetical protein